MAHALCKKDGKTSMAFVGQVPWHGLGQQLTEGASIESWIKEAGMDYTLEASPVIFDVNGAVHQAFGHQVLYRSDTSAPLGIVSDKYKVVHPTEVLEFFRDLAEEHGFSLETAGVLFSGKKYWALARTPHELMLGKKDLVQAHLMLATACDGSMSTVAKYVATRVVCNNTIQIALRENGKQVATRHNQTFDAKKTKEELGLLSDGWKGTAEVIRALGKRKVNHEEAVRYVVTLMGDKNKEVEEQIAEELSPNMAIILEKFDTQQYIGHEMSSDTAWGLLNCVTEWVDHDRGRTQDRRLEYAWLGGGMNLKAQAFEAAKMFI